MDFYEICNNVFDFFQQNIYAQYAGIAAFTAMFVGVKWFRWTVFFVVLFPIALVWFATWHDKTHNQNRTPE